MSRRVMTLEAETGTIGGWADKRISFLERQNSEQVEVNKELRERLDAIDFHLWGKDIGEKLYRQ